MRILELADEPSTGIGRVGSLAGEPSAGIGVVPCESLSSPMNPLQGSGVSERSRCGAVRILELAGEPSAGGGRREEGGGRREEGGGRREEGGGEGGGRREEEEGGWAVVSGIAVLLLLFIGFVTPIKSDHYRAISLHHCLSGSRAFFVSHRKHCR